MTEGYAADWTMGQLRNAGQRIADRIDALTEAAMPTPAANRSTGRRALGGGLQSGRHGRVV